MHEEEAKWRDPTCMRRRPSGVTPPVHGRVAPSESSPENFTGAIPLALLLMYVHRLLGHGKTQLSLGIKVLPRVVENHSEGAKTLCRDQIPLMWYFEHHYDNFFWGEPCGTYGRTYKPEHKLDAES